MTEKPSYEALQKRLRELEHAHAERKRIEERLQASESKLRHIVENSTNMFYIHGMDGRLIYLSPQSIDFLGCDPEERDLYWTEFLSDHPANSRVYALTEEAFSSGVRQPPYEAELIRRDGVRRWVEINENPLFENGRIRVIVGSLTDITERKKTLEALLESERKFRELFDSVTDLVFTQDLEGHFLSANSAMHKLFGYDREDFLGKSASDFMKTELRHLYYTEYLAGLKKRGQYEGISSYYSKNGKKIYIEYRSKLVKPENGDPYISGIGRDVTERVLAEKERKLLETQLQQAQKMEAIGTLAGGIAHNFNNVLMGILGLTSLMLMDKNASHPDFEHLKNMEGYVKHATELTNDLLGFARGGKYELKPTDLNLLVENENKMFGRTKKEISIHSCFEKNLWTVEVDRNQIRQALLNLYVNAWQAMPEGGDLYLQTTNHTIGDQDAKVHEVRPGRYVKISITDTGVGMDEATQQRIFDPFFTTRQMGRGTGLGLASVYGIVKNHGGFIAVQSQKTIGSTFDIYLPATTQKIDKKTTACDQLKVQKAHGTLLFVDDEKVAIEVGRKMAEKLGFKILEAGSGKEAVSIYKKMRNEIDLVVLDMIMPNMGGGETFDHLKRIDPSVKVLLSSGYSIEGEARKILDRGCNGFIQKPFTITRFSQKISEVLRSECGREGIDGRGRARMTARPPGDSQ